MTKLIACVFAACVLAGAALARQMTGVIADEKCKHTDIASAQCTEKCIKSGAAAVFIDTADNKVYKLANPDKAKGHYGKKVVVTGNAQGATLTIDTISDASGNRAE